MSRPTRLVGRTSSQARGEGSTSALDQARRCGRNPANRLNASGVTSLSGNLSSHPSLPAKPGARGQKLPVRSLGCGIRIGANSADGAARWQHTGYDLPRLRRFGGASFRLDEVADTFHHAVERGLEDRFNAWNCIRLFDRLPKVF